MPSSSAGKHSRSRARSTTPRGVAEASTGLALVQRTRGDYPRRRGTLSRGARRLRGTGRRGGDGAGARSARDEPRARRRDGSSPAGLRAEPQLVPAPRRFARSRARAHGLACNETRRRRTGTALVARRGEPRRFCARSATAATYGKALVDPPRTSMPTSANFEKAAAEFEEALTLFVEFGDRWFGGDRARVGGLPCCLRPETQSALSTSWQRPTPSGRRSRCRSGLGSASVTRRARRNAQPMGETRFAACVG